MNATILDARDRESPPILTTRRVLRKFIPSDKSSIASIHLDPLSNLIFALSIRLSIFIDRALPLHNATRFNLNSPYVARDTIGETSLGTTPSPKSPRVSEPGGRQHHRLCGRKVAGGRASARSILRFVAAGAHFPESFNNSLRYITTRVLSVVLRSLSISLRLSPRARGMTAGTRKILSLPRSLPSRFYRLGLFPSFLLSVRPSSPSAFLPLYATFFKRVSARVKI